MKRLLDLEGQQLAESLNKKGEREEKKATISEGKKRGTSRLRASRLTAFEDSEYVCFSVE